MMEKERDEMIQKIKSRKFGLVLQLQIIKNINHSFKVINSLSESHEKKREMLTKTYKMIDELLNTG